MERKNNDEYSVVIPTPLEANEIIFNSDEAATVNIEKYEITFN